MSLNQVSDALNLLGQTPKTAAGVGLDMGQGPKLDVAWDLFHQGIGSSIAAVLRRARVPRTFSPPASSKTVGWSDGSLAALSWPPPSGMSYLSSCRPRVSLPRQPTILPSRTLN